MPSEITETMVDAALAAAYRPRTYEHKQRMRAALEDAALAARSAPEVESVVEPIAWGYYDDEGRLFSLATKKSAQNDRPLYPAAAITERNERIGQRDADLNEFMRRLGPRWFLEQNWFPASIGARAALQQEGE